MSVDLSVRNLTQTLTARFDIHHLLAALPSLNWQLICTAPASADAKHHWGIHREAPPFVEQSTAQEILVTGIKVRLPVIGQEDCLTTVAIIAAMLCSPLQG